VAQIFGPKIVLGLISSSLGGIYAIPVIAADIGTGISVAICMQNKTQEKFEKDKDLSAFCSYVVNRSAYQLMKSRAKGYVAGKKLRAKIEKKIQDRKERRTKRREEKAKQTLID
jgi:UDP-N-acetylglucosamine:LPS N-acetylglucosamine transferase